MFRKCMLALAVVATLVVPVTAQAADSRDWERWHERHFGPRFHTWHGFSPGVDVTFRGPVAGCAYTGGYWTQVAYADGYGRLVYRNQWVPGGYNCY